VATCAKGTPWRRNSGLSWTASPSASHAPRDLYQQTRAWSWGRPRASSTSESCDPRARGRDYAHHGQRLAPGHRHRVPRPSSKASRWAEGSRRRPRGGREKALAWAGPRPSPGARRGKAHSAGTRGAAFRPRLSGSRAPAHHATSRPPEGRHPAR
jgi:hypothetical protein